MPGAQRGKPDRVDRDDLPRPAKALDPGGSRRRDTDTGAPSSISDSGCRSARMTLPLTASTPERDIDHPPLGGQPLRPHDGSLHPLPNGCPQAAMKVH